VFNDTFAESPERGLWCAVITQALNDATSVDPSNTLCRDQARTWLFGNSADFRDVCRSAGLEPEYIQTHIRKAIAAADSSAAPRKYARQKQEPRPRPETLAATLVTFDGETRSAGEWAALKGLKMNSIYGRLRRGWTIEEALTKPLRGEDETQ